MATLAQRRIPISRVVISEEEIAAVAEVLRSGNLREGPKCKEFEEAFAQSVGARHALTASSGTAALQMAYEAILQPGDEVLVPAFTFFATASMVAAVGAVPVFCDINAETLTLDVEDAARRITPRTRAIAPVHLFGNPVDVPAVQELARKHNLAIIWDAAQAHASRYGSADVGSLNGAVCYSFYPSKNMTTGEGGMVCTDDDDLVVRMKLLRSQGQPKKYVHVSIGYNFRMTDFQAVIGLGQLQRLPEWTLRRQANAAYLRSRLSATPLVRVQEEQPNGTHSYHQFSMLLDSSVNREELLSRLRSQGIDCAVFYPTPLHRQPVFAESSSHLSLAVSEDASNRIFSVPVHPHLEKEDLEYLADHIVDGVQNLQLN